MCINNSHIVAALSVVHGMMLTSSVVLYVLKSCTKVVINCVLYSCLSAGCEAIVFMEKYCIATKTISILSYESIFTQIARACTRMELFSFFLRLRTNYNNMTIFYTQTYILLFYLLLTVVYTEKSNSNTSELST